MSENSSPAIPTAQVVIVEWQDLVAAQTRNNRTASTATNPHNTTIRTALRDAYGPTGTGILAIRNVPGFVPAKDAFLPLAHTLATTLDPSYLDTHVTDATSLYNAGWSHGKERMHADRPPDTAKGSYYFNPVTDTPGTAEDRRRYPVAYPCNVWPDETHQPALAGFRDRAVAVGCCLTQATVVVAAFLDEWAQDTQSGYVAGTLQDAMATTEKVKGRLLYYFPLEGSSKEKDEGKEEGVVQDSWIGWHNDSGYLTALAGDMYVDHATGTPIPCPDPRAGLYVVDRRGSFTDNNANNNNKTHDAILRVEIPPDCLAIQIGECTQIITGGAVQATPHCVRGCAMPGVARISLPVFVDVPPSTPLTVPQGATRADVLAADCTNKVPPLDARWKDGMTFGDFLQTTFAMYYEWKA